MADIEAVRKLLADEYGIRSSQELNEAMRNIQKLNIGVFASPVRKESEQHEENCCIA